MRQKQLTKGEDWGGGKEVEGLSRLYFWLNAGLIHVRLILVPMIYVTLRAHLRRQYVSERSEVCG